LLGHRLRTTLVAIAAVALPLVACGGDDDADGETTTTSERAETTTTAAPTTTLSPDQQAEADVRAAYDAYRGMSERLASAPDPQDPEIDQRVSGPARDKLLDSLTTMQAQQERIEFGPSNSHRVVEVVVEGSTATVTDCVTDEGARVNDLTGERTEFPATAGLLVVTMKSGSGGWLVTSISKPPAAEVEPTCGG
jgi:hypothetical protein